MTFIVKICVMVVLIGLLGKSFPVFFIAVFFRCFFFFFFCFVFFYYYYYFFY